VAPPSLLNRCTYGSENLSPTSQKDFLQQYRQQGSRNRPFGECPVVKGRADIKDFAALRSTSNRKLGRVGQNLRGGGGSILWARRGGMADRPHSHPKIRAFFKNENPLRGPDAYSTMSILAVFFQESVRLQASRNRHARLQRKQDNCLWEN